MATYRNPYHDTSLGEGLNSLAIAMFSPRGPKPEDLAQRRAFEARASKDLADAADTRALMAGRENFLDAAIPSLGVAGDDVPIVQQYLKTGMFPAREDERLRMSTVPGVPVAGWTPDAERGVRELQELSAAIMAGGGNADQIMNARKTGRQLTREDQVLAGELDPTRWFQMNLKPVVDIQEGYAINPADPNVLPEELGVATSLIRQRNTDADHNLAQARKAGNEADMVRPLAQSLIDKRGRPGGGMSFRIDENGNPVIEFGESGGAPLTKPNETAVQRNVIDNTSTLDVIGWAREAGRDPRNFGLSGGIRSTVQDAIQQGDALAQTLGGYAQEVQKDIIGMGSDVGLTNFDTSIPKLDMLINVLAFRMAKMNDPGGRVTDRDFNIARDQIGGRGILANQAEFLSRLDLLEQMLAQQSQRGTNMLRGGAGPGPRPAAPLPVPQEGARPAPVAPVPAVPAAPPVSLPVPSQSGIQFEDGKWVEYENGRPIYRWRSKEDYERFLESSGGGNAKP